LFNGEGPLKYSPASPLGSQSAKRKSTSFSTPTSAGLVVRLRDLKLVEEFAGAEGRLRFATTEAFLQRFGLANLQELAAASFDIRVLTSL
jgi:hypothetical protein